MGILPDFIQLSQFLGHLITGEVLKPVRRVMNMISSKSQPLPEETLPQSVRPDQGLRCHATILGQVHAACLELDLLRPTDSTQCQGSHDT